MNKFFKDQIYVNTIQGCEYIIIVERIYEVKILYSRFIPCLNPQFMRSPVLPNTSNKQLARVYVPMQPYIGLLPLNVALKKGTVFPNLVMPYPEDEDNKNLK